MSKEAMGQRIEKRSEGWDAGMENAWSIVNDDERNRTSIICAYCVLEEQ